MELVLKTELEACVKELEVQLQTANVEIKYLQRDNATLKKDNREILNRLLRLIDTTADRETKQRNMNVMKAHFPVPDDTEDVPEGAVKEKDATKTMERLFWNPMTPEEMKAYRPDHFFPFDDPPGDEDQQEPLNGEEEAGN